MATSRSLALEAPRIPHLARPRKEVGDLRGDTDNAFSRIELELDELSEVVEGLQTNSVSPIVTDPTVAASFGQTLRVDSTIQPVVVSLPALDVLSVGKSTEIKVVTPGTPGSGLLNLVHVTPAGADTIDGVSSFVLLTKRSSVFLRSDGGSDWMIVSAYLPIGVGGSVDDLQTDTIAVSSNGQVFFSLTKTPVDSADVKMTVNGQNQTNGVDYTVIGQSVTWQNASFTLEIDDEVAFTYHF